MNEMYLLKLLKQFHEADGRTDLMKFDKDFLEWLKQYQNLLLLLKDYYQYIELQIDEWNSFEIGKGPLDSIILNKANSISINNDPESEIFIFKGMPYCVSKKGMTLIENSDLFYTYNPYTIEDIKIINKLYKINELVAISAVGKIFDKDKESKIKQLKQQFSDLDINYEKSDDNYFYTLYSPRNLKKLIKK